jgi:hypothetical protein
MRRELFVPIAKTCENKSFYFARWRNPTGLLGFSPHQKILAAIKTIAYVISADYTNEYLCIGEDTLLKRMRLFAKVLIQDFGAQYL